MKSMRPPLAAIFFMTYFYRAMGAPWPLGPPGSATAAHELSLSIPSILFTSCSDTINETWWYQLTITEATIRRSTMLVNLPSIHKNCGFHLKRNKSITKSENTFRFQNKIFKSIHNITNKWIELPKSYNTRSRTYVAMMNNKEEIWWFGPEDISWASFADSLV